MADLGIRAGDKVLLVWARPSTPAALKQRAEELGAAVGGDGRVAVENMERLLLCEFLIPLIPSLSCSGKLSTLHKHSVIPSRGRC